MPNAKVTQFYYFHDFSITCTYINQCLCNENFMRSYNVFVNWNLKLILLTWNIFCFLFFFFTWIISFISNHLENINPKQSMANNRGVPAFILHIPYARENTNGRKNYSLHITFYIKKQHLFSISILHTFKFCIFI